MCADSMNVQHTHAQNFIKVDFSISAFIASSVQGERGLPGPKGEIKIPIS